MNTVLKYLDNYAIPLSLDKEFGELLNTLDKDLLAIEGLTRDYLDVSKRLDEYSDEDLSTFSIEGNSNATGAKNYLSRQGEVFKSLEKVLNYHMLWKSIRDNFDLETANKCIKESIEGGFMIHDMTNGGVDMVYCSMIPTSYIMKYGRPYNTLHSNPPRYADSFIGQVIEFIIDASSRFSGAISTSDIFINLAYYSKNENLNDKQIQQLLQRLVHLVNNPYRSSFQSPFYNCSILPKSGIMTAFGGYKYPNGESCIDYMDEILKVQKIFVKYFGKGIEDAKGVYKPATFPVVTLNVVRDYIKDDYEYIQEILKCFNKFDNVNIYIGDADKFASCCRIVNDYSRGNSINSFGSGAIGQQVIGSSRVITMGLSDIALETKEKHGNDKEKYFEVLKEKMSIAKDILYAQRKLAEKRFAEGFNIFHNIGWIKLSDYFSTYGAGGLFEATKILFDGDTNKDYTKEELEFAKKIPKFMEDFASDNSDEFMKLNVEFLTPLESGAKRLGRRIDKKYNKRNTFVSNQLTPLTLNVSLSKRMYNENELGGATSAGGIWHIGTEGEMPFDMKMKLLNKIVTEYPNIEHFAFNKTASYCEEGHLTLKNIDICPFCNKPIVEKILRVIGYYRPVKTWSDPRQKEFEKRQFYTLEQQTELIDEKENSNE